MKGLLSALCFLGATTGLGLDGANDPPAPADLPPPTAAAPAAPTDTERLLLERIEKLEKRLAEIESARGEIAREPAGTTAAPPPSTAVGSATAASTTVSAPRIASSTPSAATFAGTLPNPLQS